MNKTSKIFIAGHLGMVGSACMRLLKKEGYSNVIGKTRLELDLTKQEQVEIFFKTEKLVKINLQAFLFIYIRYYLPSFKLCPSLSFLVFK